MAGGSFWTMLRIAGFFAAVWFAGKSAKFIRVSSIVTEILVGLVFAPGLLPIELLPRTYSTCSHENHQIFGKETIVKEKFCSDEGIYAALEDTTQKHKLFEVIDYFDVCTDEKTAWENNEFQDQDGKLKKCMKKYCAKKVDYLCGSEPNIFSLVGHAGVGLMIFESGMHFDFDGCKKVLPRATVVAIFGTFLPLIAGMLLTWAFGYKPFPEGLAAGTALAPTSVGIALKLLMEAKVLQKDFGQLILSAAFVDDILSLIIFNILFAVTSPSGFDLMTCVIFPVVGIVFMLSFGALGISFWPSVVARLEKKIPTERRFNEAMMVLMFTLLLGYGSFTMFLGTHLWGAFVAGMSFAGVHKCHHIWSQQTKRITAWMLRIFFSCTVSFAIPVKTLFTLKAFGYGSIMGIVACILTKVVSGVCMGKARFVIGWAMVGRAEFAYLIAEMARSGGIMGAEMFSIVVWALLYATIIAPIVFKKVLQNYVLAETVAEGGKAEDVPELERAGTLHGALPDIIAEEEKANKHMVQQKCSDMESELEAKDQEIAALKQRIANMEGQSQDVHYPSLFDEAPKTIAAV